MWSSTLHPVRFAMLIACLLLGGCISATSEPGVDEDLLEQIAVVPPTINVQAGASFTFDALGVLASGDSVEIAVTWASSGGDMDAAQGRWQAPATAGEYEIIATHGDLTGVAIATVVAENIELQSIEIVPGTVNVMPSSSVSFQAIGTLGNGAKIAIDAAWEATGGTINGATGSWQAPGAPGTYQITATHETFSAQATANVITVSSNEPVFDPSENTLHYFDDFNYNSIAELEGEWRVHSPGTTSFGPNDPWTGTKSLVINYSGSGQMYRGIAKYSGFQNMGSGRGPDVMIFELGLRFTGSYFEGKEHDLLGSTWRFDWKPVGDGSVFGHRSISCGRVEDDPFKQIYFDNDGDSKVAGNAPECGYHTSNTYLTGGFTSYIYKQNVNWGLGPGQFDLRQNASMDGQGASINDGRWRIFKIRVERRTGGEAVGDGRYEMWVGFDHGSMLKIMEFDGAVGQRDEGFVWIGTESDPLLDTIRLYELSAHAWNGPSTQIYIGYWRAWSP